MSLVPQTARVPYFLQEDKAILRYIIDGHYESVINGNNIWKQMEKDQVCKSRSWQSLRNRFFKNIAVDISRPEYGLTQDEKTGIRVYLSKPLKPIAPQKPKRTHRFIPKSSGSSNPADEPSRTFALYTVEEDKAILKYILNERLECFVKGNDLWIQMEAAKICPSRTWQSLKNRFKRYIMPICSSPEYGLSSEQQLRLKTWISPPPQSSHVATTSEASGHDDEGSEVGINSDTSSEDGTVVGSKASARTSKSKANSATSQKDFFSLDMSSDSDD